MSTAQTYSDGFSTAWGCVLLRFWTPGLYDKSERWNVVGRTLPLRPPYRLQPCFLSHAHPPHPLTLPILVKNPFLPETKIFHRRHFHLLFLPFSYRVIDKSYHCLSLVTLNFQQHATVEKFRLRPSSWSCDVPMHLLLSSSVTIEILLASIFNCIPFIYL